MHFHLIAEAEKFAKAAHDSINHRRKYTDEPYWVHPARVSNMVASETKDESVVSAAWLHDVLEDVAPLNPKFNSAAIQNAFGDRVLKLVLEVTDVSNKKDGNRAARKSIDRAHLMKASDDGKLIKLADLIDNIIDIDLNDPGFSRIFRKEVALDLDNLRSGNERLYLKLASLLSQDRKR
jgi:(p)ppGpp synthase/HD superfamily hydrolase